MNFSSEFNLVCHKLGLILVFLLAPNILATSARTEFSRLGFCFWAFLFRLSFIGLTAIHMGVYNTWACFIWVIVYFLS